MSKFIVKSFLLQVLAVSLLAPLQAGGQASLSTSGADLRKLQIDDAVFMRRLKEVQISPDGSKVAFVVEEAADELHSKDVTYSSLWVVSTSGGDPRQYTTTQGAVSSPKWSPDGESLAFLSTRPGPSNNQVFLISQNGKGLRQLTRRPSSVLSLTWSPDGKKIAFVSATGIEDPEKRKRMDLGFDEFEVTPNQPPERRNRNGLWTVELKGGKAEEVNVGGVHVMAAQWSPDGKRFLLTVADEPYPDAEQMRPRLVTVDSPGGTPQVYCATVGKLQGAAWAPDGSSIAFLGSRENGTDFYPGGLFVCRGEGSTPVDVVEGSSFAAKSFRWMPDSRGFLAPAGGGGHRRLVRINVQDKKVTPLTPSEWEVSSGSDYSVSLQGDRIVCVLATSTKPPEVWTAAVPDLLANKGLKRLTRLNPKLEERAFGEGEVISWKAADGWEISGVLIKPVGYRPGTRYPLIVQIHGSNGEDANDFHLGPNDWGQLLATHGYAVLMANYRGSFTGSYQFRRGNRGDFGGKDSTDILSGVDYLIEKGIADPERLGVGGVSYGGYMTNWLVTQTPRFKAAVSLAGFSNWISFHGAEDAAPESLAQEQWGISPYRNTKLLWDRSPIAHVGDVKTPTLIVMGERDPVIPVSQGVGFLRGLRHFGVKSQLFVYPREGHGLREPNHVRNYFERALTWFDDHLAPSH